MQKYKTKENLNDEILKKFNLLNKKFIFYPAQYWAHKNHIYILEALKLMHDKNSDLEITAVFCGFDKNNLDYLKSISKKLGIQNNVIF